MKKQTVKGKIMRSIFILAFLSSTVGFAYQGVADACAYTHYPIDGCHPSRGLSVYDLRYSPRFTYEFEKVLEATTHKDLVVTRIYEANELSPIDAKAKQRIGLVHLAWALMGGGLALVLYGLVKYRELRVIRLWNDLSRG